MGHLILTFRESIYVCFNCKISLKNDIIWIIKQSNCNKNKEKSSLDRKFIKILQNFDSNWNFLWKANFAPEISVIFHEISPLIFQPEISRPTLALTRYFSYDKCKNEIHHLGCWASIGFYEMIFLSENMSIKLLIMIAKIYHVAQFFLHPEIEIPFVIKLG